MTEPLMTVDALATYLDVPRSWIYTNASQIPHTRIGSRMYRFRKSEIDAWLESCRGGPAKTLLAS